MVKEYTYGHAFTIREAEKLVKTILSLKNQSEAEAFLQDLLTPQELEDLTRRILAAQLLASGKTFNEVRKELKMSPTTLQKVYKSLWAGYGGYRDVLKRL